MKNIDGVVGFLFDEDMERVVLINKLRPEWQRNLLNGVGGGIEKDETPVMAMRREFKEEAGLYIDNWELLATLNCLSVKVYYFKAIGDVDSVETMTDEIVVIKTLEQSLAFVRDKDYVWPTNWVLRMARDEELVLPIEMNYRTDGRKR